MNRLTPSNRLCHFVILKIFRFWRSFAWRIAFNGLFPPVQLKCCLTWTNVKLFSAEKLWKIFRKTEKLKIEITHREQEQLRTALAIWGVPWASYRPFYCSYFLVERGQRESLGTSLEGGRWLYRFYAKRAKRHPFSDRELCTDTNASLVRLGVEPVTQLLQWKWKMVRRVTISLPKGKYKFVSANIKLPNLSEI